MDVNKIPKKVFADPEQRAKLKKDIEGLVSMAASQGEDSTNEIGNYNFATKHLDLKEVRREIATKKKRLKDITPNPLTVNVQNLALQKARAIKTWIIENKPKEAYVRYHNSEAFEKSVQAATRWLKHGSDMENRYNYLMQRIDPSLPREGFDKHTKERA